MVAGSTFVQPTEGVVHSEIHTKCFIGDKDQGEGNLYVTESLLLWKCENADKCLEIQYPSISLHAISRDTTNFPHECLYCLLESSDPVESDERDPEPGVTEIRFVPLEKDHIKAIYDAVTACQELHPDPDDEGSMGEEYDNGEETEEQMIDNTYYTADSNIEDVELSEDGQAVLNRLQQNMQILSEGEFSEMMDNGQQSKQNGQFDDADEIR